MNDGARILIVDDDPNLRKTLVDILKLKGYEVSSAANGVEAINLMSRSDVNLVVIDLGLPDVSGLEVLGRVKAHNPLTEAIILTGNATLDSAMEAINKGAFSYLTKPYEMDELMLHIRRALEKQTAQETIIKHSIEQEQMNAKLREMNGILVRECAERKRADEEKERLIGELREALSKIKTLTGLLPICSNCKRVRNDKDQWESVETYIRDRSEADFSHGICPECARKLYPEFYKL